MPTAPRGSWPPRRSIAVQGRSRLRSTCASPRAQLSSGGSFDRAAASSASIGPVTPGRRSSRSTARGSGRRRGRRRDPRRSNPDRAFGGGHGYRPAAVSDGQRSAIRDRAALHGRRRPRCDRHDPDAVGAGRTSGGRTSGSASRSATGGGSSTAAGSLPAAGGLGSHPASRTEARTAGLDTPQDTDFGDLAAKSAGPSGRRPARGRRAGRVPDR